jgi:hypothetical protein
MSSVPPLQRSYHVNVLPLRWPFSVSVSPSGVSVATSV